MNRSRKISQREARRLKARVQKLEDVLDSQRKNWRGEWPSGHEFFRMVRPDSMAVACVKTARALLHAVVVMNQGDDLIFFGVEIPEVEL